MYYFTRQNMKIRIYFAFDNIRRFLGNEWKFEGRTYGVIQVGLKLSNMNQQ